MKHLLDIQSLSRDDLRELLERAAKLKAQRQRGVPSRSLAGKTVALIFEKPSLRTRVSFEAGTAQLGGTSIFLPGNEAGLGWRETHADIAKTLSRYIDCMVLRVFQQSTVEQMAQYGSVPVINGLSDRAHPCQALADLLTVRETFGSIEGKTILFVGDGNNVAMSLALACAKLGCNFQLVCPEGYEFDEHFEAAYRGDIGVSLPKPIRDPAQAIGNADVIYTDVWTSMGQEAEREVRLQKFAPFQLNAELMAKAPKHAKVLHCLPAHRGEEITAEVIDGPQSAVFEQAENRLHAQKAVLEWLLT